MHQSQANQLCMQFHMNVCNAVQQWSLPTCLSSILTGTHHLQALSALLWRPHDNNSSKPTWNKLHINWGKATMALGATAVCLGIHVSGVGWPWYLLFASQTGTILGAAYYIDPMNSNKKVRVRTASAVSHDCNTGFAWSCTGAAWHCSEDAYICTVLCLRHCGTAHACGKPFLGLLG